VRRGGSGGGKEGQGRQRRLGSIDIHDEPARWRKRRGVEGAINQHYSDAPGNRWRTDDAAGRDSWAGSVADRRQRLLGGEAARDVSKGKEPRDKRHYL
jgi:hypothetical protein